MSQRPALSTSTKLVLICTTTIVGTLLLALLIYSVWRRQLRTSSRSDTVWRRPGSSTAVISPPQTRDPRVSGTLLPIFKEECFSVRVTENANPGNSSNSIIPPPVLGSVTVEALKNQHPWMKSDTWKTTNPPPMHSSSRYIGGGGGIEGEGGEGTSAFRDLSNRVSVPEMAHLRMSLRHARDRFAARTSRRISSKNETPRIGPIDEETASISSTCSSLTSRDEQQEDEEEVHEEQEKKPEDRWSWTNSHAPSTPRMRAPSLPHSLHSLSGFHGVQCWVPAERKDAP